MSSETAASFAGRIMIVDDEPVNIKVAKKYLQIAGYRDFVTSTDSANAVQTVRQSQPDILLLDIMMPQVSGLDILQAIRADDELRHLPIIFLTASADAKTKV